MRTSMVLSCAVAATLLVALAAQAQPTPVRPAVNPVSRPGTNPVQVRLQQDRCYQWSAPVVDRSGNTFNITQSVRPSPATCNAQISNRFDVDLGQLPVGDYRAVYSASVTDMAPIAGSTLEFSVRARGTGALVIDPARPVAFEPINVRIPRAAGCEHISAFRAVAGGFELEYTQTNFNGMQCDGIDEINVGIGAYPPGSYFIRVVRPPSQGSVVVGTLAFEVLPNAPLTTTQQLEDVSGTWNSPDEEPGTAIVFFNSADISPEGPRSGLAGVWYRYDNTGRATWYYLEQNSVYEYRATNPAEPGFRRALAREAIGSFQVDLGGQFDNRPRMVGTIRGQPFDIRLQRFRWTRAAWAPLRVPTE